MTDDKIHQTFDQAARLLQAYLEVLLTRAYEGADEKETIPIAAELGQRLGDKIRELVEEVYEDAASVVQESVKHGLPAAQWYGREHAELIRKRAKEAFNE